MTLDRDDTVTLLKFIASVTPDKMTCDSCLEHVPELAESQLGNNPLSEVLEKVRNHLDNCPCCAGEYETFLEALRAIENH